MPRIDVLVVGAGPAGATAAYHAARAGLSTVFIDRKVFPRAKVCGDGVTPRALRALARMGVVNDALVASRVEGLRLMGAGRSVTYRFEDDGTPFSYGAVIPRLVLDERIRRAAESVGAEFRGDLGAVDFEFDREGRVRGVWVDGVDGHELLDAKLTIVADGASGRLGRRLRGDRAMGSYSAFAARQYWRDVVQLEPYLEVWMPLRWRGQTLVGYAWVFPVSQSSANVGVGLLAEPGHTDRVRLPEVLGSFVDEVLRRDPRFVGATMASEVEAGPINSRMVDPAVVPAGALLVGDAAGLVNPFTAEGIAYALESGELAARTAVAMLSPGHASMMSYRASLVARLPHHWVTRGSPRHFRWLMALAPRLLDRDTPSVLVETLRRFVFDTELTDPRASSAGGTTYWLYQAVRHRAVDRVRAVDEMLGELVDMLLADPRSPSCVPLATASFVAAHTRATGGNLVEALAGLTLLSLANSLLAEIPQDACADDALASVAIIFADCVTTEAVAILAPLAGMTFRRVVAAFSETSDLAQCAAGVSGVVLTSELATRYALQGAPTRCAVEMIVEAGDVLDAVVPSDETAPFASWGAAVQLAAADLRRDGSAEVASYLDEMIGISPAMPSSWDQSLREELRRQIVSVAVASIPASLGDKRAATVP